MPKRSPTSPPSARKKAKQAKGDAVPHITSRTEPRTSQPASPTLTGKRLHVYRMLVQALDDVDDQGISKGTAVETKLRIAAAIGLVTVMAAERLEAIDMSDIVYFIETDGLVAQNILNRWIKSGTMQAKTSRTTATLTAQKRVRDWYGDLCVLTHVEQPTEVCHIVPNALERTKWGLSSFLGGIGLFWSVSERDQLRSILEDPVHERINLLVLRSDVHDLWDKGLFCFEPLTTDDSDHTTLRVKFVWLSNNTGHTSPLSFETPPTSKYGVMDPQTHRPLESGDIVILTTDDKDQYPLPNRCLLQWQCNLHKALRVSAAADVCNIIFRRREAAPEVPSGPTTTTAVSDHGEAEDEDRSLKFPYLAEYLIQEALSCGNIAPEEVADWRRTFDPSCGNPDLPLWQEEEEEELLGQGNALSLAAMREPSRTVPSPAQTPSPATCDDTE